MPIKSEKEEITWSFLSLDNSTTKVIRIAIAEDSPTTAGDVEIGDTIKWFFLEANFSAETITNTKIVHWICYKLKAGQTAPSPITYDQQTKSQILKRGMEMLPKDVGTTIKRIFVVRVPRGFQRMADGDTLNFAFTTSSAETINACGISIFKHFG